VDDDLDLLPDQDGDGVPGRRPWGLLAVAVVVALVAVSGLVWVIGSVTGGGETRPAAASPTAGTPTPTTTSTSPSATATVAAPSPTRSIPTILGPAPPPAGKLKPTPTRTPTLPPPPSPKPQLVRVPDVIGQRLASATLTLRAAGFKVSVLGAGVPAPKPDQRRVRWQTPTGGTPAPRGATVVLLLDST
jgi:hypothetical protein